MLVVSVCLVLFLSLPPLGGTKSETEGQCGTATPMSFEDRFQENCRKYPGLTTDVCIKAWNSFLGAFNGRDASEVQQELVGTE